MDVELPNGQIIKDIPEGTTKTQLREKLEKNGMWDRSWDPEYSRAGVQGAARGLVDAISTPADIAGMAANAALTGAEALGAPHYRFPITSDTVADLGSQAAESMGYDVIDPNDMSTGESITYNVNRFGGQGASLGRAIDDGTTALANSMMRGRPVSRVLEATGLRPQMIETAAGVGSGLGLTMAEEGNLGPIGNMVSMLLGGLLGGTAANRATHSGTLRGAIHDTFNSDPEVTASPEGRKYSYFEVDEARKSMQNDAVDPLAAAREITDRTQQFNNLGYDSQPSTFLKSNDEGLIGRYRAMARDLENADLVERNRRVQAEASGNITGLVDESADPYAAEQMARDKAGAMRADVDQKVDAADAQVKAADELDADLGSQLKEKVDEAYGSSGRLDTALTEKGLTPLQDEQNAIYAKIPGDVEIDATPIVEAMRALEADVPTGFDSPGFGDLKLRNLVDVDPETGEEVIKTMTSADLKKYRIQLSNSIADARQAGNRNLTDRLISVKKITDSMADELPGAEDAVRFSREEIAPRYGSGEAKKFREDIHKDDRHRSKTPPSRTAARFLESDDEAAVSLRNALKGTEGEEAGVKAAQEYLAGRMATVLKDDGTINPASLERWRNKNIAKLEEFGLTKQVDDLIADARTGKELRGEADELVKQAQKFKRDTERAIQDDAFFRIIDKEPRAQAAAVIDSKDPLRSMRQVLANIGDNEKARASWKRAVSEYMSDKLLNTNTASTADGSRNVSYANIVRTMDRHKDTLALVYSKEEMKAIEGVRDTLDVLSRETIRGGGPGTTTSEDMAKLGALTRAYLNVKYGILKAGGIIRTARGLSWLFDKVDPSIGADELLRRAAFDPELAVHLLSTPKAIRKSQPWNRKLVTLIAGLELGRNPGEDEDNKLNVDNAKEMLDIAGENE